MVEKSPPNQPEEGYLKMYRPPHMTFSAPDLIESSPKKCQLQCGMNSEDGNKPIADDSSPGELHGSTNDLEVPDSNTNANLTDKSPDTKRRCTPTRGCPCAEEDATSIPPIPPPMHPLVRRAISLPDVSEIQFTSTAPERPPQYYVTEAVGADENEVPHHLVHENQNVHLPYHQQQVPEDIIRYDCR